MSEWKASLDLLRASFWVIPLEKLFWRENSGFSLVKNFDFWLVKSVPFFSSTFDPNNISSKTNFWKIFHPFKASFILRVRGKDDDGRRKIISEEIQNIPVEYRMQASDVKEAVRKLILNQVNIITHTNLALQCIELTRSRLGIHPPFTTLRGVPYFKTESLWKSLITCIFQNQFLVFLFELHMIPYKERLPSGGPNFRKKIGRFKDRPFQNGKKVISTMVRSMFLEVIWKAKKLLLSEMNEFSSKTS